MSSKVTILIAAGLAVAFVFVSDAQNARSGTSSEKRKPVMMTRLYTGPDGQTHAQEVEAKFTAGNTNEVFKLIAITGAELHRAAPGTVIDWHTAPRRQYVITLSGQGEIEVAGGKKFTVGPGHIDLVEDTTGKGHITRVTGNEDRVTLQLPLSDHPVDD
jgi:quercetin dioxygenase-like cupin family protein